ncbi:helix-turn-helix transcriptional regulator [Pigmentiphaga aceris]|uniref:Helix-turn-helix transcriptional regulator n=2 Tax=Pigmentiphaga aceris TaxID=1940612 RepID=A0A5C0B491_9BURK|nr:helix-turn-helix transcriptional regulator [Pigmentiphaga aceris]
MSTLSERMKEARVQAGLSQAELAKQLGAGQSTIASIENGRNQSSGRLVEIAQLLQVNPTWLASGQGPRKAQAAIDSVDASDQIVVWEKLSDLPPDENRTWIDRYDLLCSAGTGIIQWEIRQKQALPFTIDFFKAIGSKPEHCRLASARGNSMEPFLFDRDMIMIDISKTTVRDGNVYAVCFEDETLVKQLFKQAGGALMLHSYNAKYPDRIVPASEETSFQVIGQVIYRSGSGLPGV